MPDQLKTIEDVQERIKGTRFAMVTTIDERGTLSSRPLTVQRFDDSGGLWFLVNHNADWVAPLDGGPINASIADDDTWVSFAGRAVLLHDQASIEKLKDPASDSRFDDDADPVVLHIATDRIEWWKSASEAAQLINMVKSKLTDTEPDLGNSGSIET